MTGRFGRVLAVCALAICAGSAALAQTPPSDADNWLPKLGGADLATDQAPLRGRRLDLQPPLPGEPEGSTYELAARNANNFDPLVDLATPNDIGTAPHAPNAAMAAPHESSWAHLGLYGNGFYWLFGGPSYFPPVEPPPRPVWAKEGMWQRLTPTLTCLLPGGDNGMGVCDLELKPLLGVPLPSYTWPILLTPGVGLHTFNGPSTTDVPGAVYDAYLDIRWIKLITPGVGLELGLTPGWYSDFEQTGGDAFRMGGRAIGAFTYSPALQIIAGVAYLDRFDVSILPVGGLIWTPDPDRRFELIVPRPKAAWRMDSGCESGRWLYVAGEFGGGMWAIERANGQNDRMVYRDYRLVLGMERTTAGGIYGRVEAGLVFGRRIEYDRFGRDRDLDPTLMMRAEMAF